MGKNLIDKLSAIGRSKIVRRIAAITLAGALVFPVALSLGACGKNNTTNVDPNGTQTQPGGNHTGEEPDLTGFSDILKTVLTSDYYKDLTQITDGSTTLTSQKRHQNPFGFLQEQGYDLADYLSGRLEVVSDAYIKGNDTSHLYISTRVECEHEQGDYYTCYTLKYELSTKEYNDLKMLHEGEYIQAPFFIQELSYEKEPTIVSEARISKKPYAAIRNNIKVDKDLNIFNGKDFELDFVGYDASAGTKVFTYSVNIRPEKSGSSMIIPDNRIYHLTVKTGQGAGNLTNYGNNVFAGPIPGFTENLEEYQNKYETITYFESDYYIINHSNPVKSYK